MLVEKALYKKKYDKVQKLTYRRPSYKPFLAVRPSL